METNNLTFKQKLILAMTHAYINSQIFDSFTDEVAGRIKELAEKLSEGNEEEPLSKATIPLDAKLIDYGLHIRPLYHSGITTVGDLIQRTPHELLRLRNFGRRSLMQTEAFLGRHGLKLKG